MLSHRYGDGSTWGVSGRTFHAGSDAIRLVVSRAVLPRQIAAELLLQEIGRCGIRVSAAVGLCVKLTH